MSTKTADELECESVTEIQLVESFVSLERKIKPSDEFLQVLELSYEFSKNRGQLKKKQIRTMETQMDKLYRKVTNSGKVTLDDNITLAYSYHTLCNAYLMQSNQKEELRISNDLVLRCLNLIRDKQLDPKYILLALKSYSHLGYIHYKQKRIEKSIQVYEKAVELYLTYTQENAEYDSLIDLEDIINNPPVQLNGYEKLNNLYVFILELLIDIHESTVPINNHSLMRCSHLLLAAKLSKLSETEEYVKWVEKAIILCGYLLKYNRFVEARNHLSIGIYVMKLLIAKKRKDSVKKQCMDICDLNEHENDVFYLPHMYWVKLQCAVLRESTKRLLRLEKDEDSGTDNLKSEHSTKPKQQVSQRLLLFYEVKRGLPFPSEHQLKTVKFISGYYEAQSHFIKLLSTIFHYISDLAKHFRYENDTKNINMYVQFKIDIGNIYKYMSLYEENTVNRISLQKQRINLLAYSINLIHSKHSNALRYLRLQGAIAYSPLIGIKFEHMERFYAVCMPQKHDATVIEIKRLIAQALRYLKMYIGAL